MTPTTKKAFRFARIFLALIVALAIVPACDSSDEASLTIVNESSFIIEDIHVVDVGAPTWGPDLLGADALFPGESLTVEVPCDFYDALVVDEDGFSCELLDIELCFEDAVWIIDDLTLNECI